MWFYKLRLGNAGFLYYITLSNLKELEEDLDF